MILLVAKQITEVIVKNNNIVEYTKHDPALARMSIFRPISKGARTNKTLDVSLDYNNVNIRVQSMELLDARDQTILLALIAMANMQKEKISINYDSTNEIEKELWNRLSTFPSTEGNSIAFYTSFYRIMKICNLDTCGKSYKLVEESLLRLAKTNITIKMGRSTVVTRLIASLSFNEKADIAIAINPRIAEAITGQYIIINIEQRNLLKNDTAKILYSYLSSVINEGNKIPYKANITTLIEKTWGEEYESNSTGRGRKKQIKDSIEAISVLPGWKIKLNKDVYSIIRERINHFIPKIEIEVDRQKKQLVL